MFEQTSIRSARNVLTGDSNCDPCDYKFRITQASLYVSEASESRVAYRCYTLCVTIDTAIHNINVQRRETATIRTIRSIIAMFIKRLFEQHLRGITHLYRHRDSSDSSAQNLSR